MQHGWAKFRMSYLVWAYVLGTGLVSSCIAADPTPAQVEFFEKKIRPVLAEKCYGCHNSKMKTPLGGLRLDTRDGLAQGGDSGKAIIPGSPDTSRLIQALTYKHELKMPPSGKLPDSYIEDFSAWVRDGAPDPRTAVAVTQPVKQAYSFAEGLKFWAFQPVQLPSVPKVHQKDWVKSPVDAFILAKLEESSLTPAAAADRATLLRRVTFDLTGLPPTPAELDAFVRDGSRKAWAKVVDRLLESPHYGERWARHWLDLVRYAETNGHEYDNEKLAPWRYRDYVIRAFNEDVPYDRFVREHIAGDLLNSTRLRTDGGIEESPLGTTSLWFNEVLNSATDSEKSRADDVDNQIDVAGKTFLGLTVACARCHDHKFDPIPTADYYALAGVFHSTDLREASIDSPERAARIQKISRKIQDINRKIDRIAPQRPVSTSPVSYRSEDKVFERFDAAGFGKWESQGIAFGTSPLNGVVDSAAAGSEVFAGTLTSPKFRTGKELYLHVRIAGTKADPKLKERGTLRFTIVADGYKGQHIVPDGNSAPKWKTLKLTFERERMCYFEIVDRRRDGYIAIDEIAFSSSEKPPSQDENPETETDSELADSTTHPDLEPLLKEKRRLEAEVPESEFAMIAEDRDVHNVRLHIRGNHKNLGDEVPRHFLQIIAGEKQPPIASGSGRLEIAGWMASPRNPLTARVMVNRIWKHHFGQGIVRSTDNFGKMGEAPTHPELLDYLASRFVKSGWSVKEMHRLMLLSSTYQMSSEASQQAKERDPVNKLLQHMPVQRLEAEAIRDSMLSISGSLNDTLYGPSVPPFISSWQDGRGKPESGPLDGDGRRSIYIQVRRNFMTPMFVAFDYPVPISTIGSRTVSTVPSQALLMMNNEFVSQQAVRWSAKEAKSAPDPAERLRSMYLRAFARQPSAEELASVMAFVKGQQTRDESEVWADVAHVMLNSAEFIYLR